YFLVLRCYTCRRFQLTGQLLIGTTSGSAFDIAMNVHGEIYLAAANGESRVVSIESPRFAIGRGTENYLCIPGTVISRSHAELIRVGTNFLLRDLGSTNGSFVNGVRVTEQMLNAGDPQAAELQKLIKERSLEYSLDFISQLRPWNPISKLIRDVLREPK